MVLIICVDDRMGMAFHKRRQSRDQAVCEDIVKLTDGEVIGMDERSLKLFEGIHANIKACKECDDCAYYFLEFDAPSVFADKAERIILYRWNRHYPADLRFDIPLDRYELTETSEFIGKSHERITKEVYEK